MLRAESVGRPSIFVLGAGKVGSGLARALRGKGVAVDLRPARRSLPRAVDAEVVVVAVRDGDIAAVARRLVGRVPRGAVVVHVAGSLDADVLAPLRGHCAGVAQMHPLLAFASTRFAPSFQGATLLVRGDAPAVTRARRIARLLGMVPRTFPALDAVSYHAAAGLVANGGAALAAMGAQLLAAAGVPAKEAGKLLAPLLRSVAENIGALGFPAALTGPVRRGDAVAVEKHLTAIAERVPAAVPLYVAVARAQLPMAKELGEGMEEGFEGIEGVLSSRR